VWPEAGDVGESWCMVRPARAVKRRVYVGSTVFDREHMATA
jgi:hypothetical protein